MLFLYLNQKRKRIYSKKAKKTLDNIIGVAFFCVEVFTQYIITFFIQT